MKKRAIILENIRSAYNVGNLIRTADGLRFDVIISWYTPSPLKEPRVLKTSLGAEKNVKIQEFWNPKSALLYAKEKYKYLIGAEYTTYSVALDKFEFPTSWAIILGNEIHGLLPESFELADYIVHIPMLWIKQSFNVGQAGAIFMREGSKNEFKKQ